MLNSIVHEPHPKAPQRVLVIDDEANVRSLVVRWMTNAGYQCAEAAGAAQAIAHLRDNEVHLITLDLQLPGANGLRLLREIRGAHPNTATIVVTGTDDVQTAVDTLTNGATAYLLKPVQREQLLFHAEQAFRRRRAAIRKRRHMRTLEKQVRQHTAALRAAQEETIHRLVNASLWRDEETGMHIRRTALVSEVLAKAAGWSAAAAETLRLATPMHDVGKIGIRDAILRKPGKLTPDEVAIMQSHVLIGAKMLEHSRTPMLRMAREIALNHHEHWDGTGYPTGLAGEQIPAAARIVAIADVYDALSHDRVYRRAFPQQRVLTMMREGSGTHFDPFLLGLFFAHYEEIRQIIQQLPDGIEHRASRAPSPQLAATGGSELGPVGGLAFDLSAAVCAAAT